MGLRVLHDLSHPIRHGQPGWPDDPPTTVETWPVPGGAFRLSQVSIGEHSGTHLGAPSHYGFPGTLSELEPQDLGGRLLVLRLDKPADDSPDGRAVPVAQRISALLDAVPAGRLPVHTVLVATGWARHWGSPGYYSGFCGDGSDVPGLDLPTVEEILTRTACRILGIDAPGLDSGGVHGALDCGRTVAARGAYHLENCATPPADLDHETDLDVVVAPLGISGGQGAPCRVFITECGPR